MEGPASLPLGPPIASFRIAMRPRYLSGYGRDHRRSRGVGRRAQSPGIPRQSEKLHRLVDRLDKRLGRLPDRAEPRADRCAQARARRGRQAGPRRRQTRRDLRRLRAAGIPQHSENRDRRERKARPARKAIADDNPKARAQMVQHKTPPVTLAVNATYPDGAPRSTVAADHPSAPSETARERRVPLCR